MRKRFPVIRRIPVPSPVLLWSAVVRGKNHHPLPDRHLYGYARQALLDGYRLLGLQKGDLILYPDYICDVTLVPCHRMGLTVRYFPTADNFEPDWDTLYRMARDGEAKAALSVNFFGIPQSLERWRNFSAEFGIWWIEDNAHGYGGKHHGRDLGSFGDLGVTGMRKVLPVLNGAFLKINSEPLLERMKHFPESIPTKAMGREELIRLIVFASEWTKIPLRKAAKWGATAMDPVNEWDHRPNAMDYLSRSIFYLTESTLPVFPAKRRSIYRAWEAFCTENGLLPAFDALPPESSPLVFPCYARNPGIREKWLRWGAVKGIDVHGWPSLPRALREPSDPMVGRWSRLLCFPIHQNMDPARDIFRLPPP